ncbi:MAG: hemerythrin domain-containing protein [Hyphomicrobiales bacterium]
MAHFKYKNPENHVKKRDGLSPTIKKTLLESTREDWPKHRRYQGMAGFWLNIHRNLLQGTNQLADGFESLLDTPPSEIQDEINARKLQQMGNQVISHLHHHHEIEDHNYFPQFIQLYPNMEHAINLLDGDHKILDQALQDTQLALVDMMAQKPVDRDMIAQVAKGSRALEKIITRHLWDEEEIIIPILLEHG